MSVCDCVRALMNKCMHRACVPVHTVCYEAVQVLHNADGGEGVSNFLEKSVTKV